MTFCISVDLVFWGTRIGGRNDSAGRNGKRVPLPESRVQLQAPAGSRASTRSGPCTRASLGSPARLQNASPIPVSVTLRDPLPPPPHTRRTNTTRTRCQVRFLPDSHRSAAYELRAVRERRRRGVGDSGRLCRLRSTAGMLPAPTAGTASLRGELGLLVC